MSYFPEPGTVEVVDVGQNIRADMVELLNALIEKVDREDCDIVGLMVAGIHADGSYLGATAVQDGMPLKKITESLQLLNQNIYEANEDHEGNAGAAPFQH